MSAYYTQTKRVTADGYGYGNIAIDSNEYRAMIAAGETFRFIKKYELPNRSYKFSDKTLEVALTCRQEIRRNSKDGKEYKFYYAHWRQPNYHKKLKKAYLGKEPTLDKLNEICDRFFDEFDNDLA